MSPTNALSLKFLDKLFLLPMRGALLQIYRDLLRIYNVFLRICRRVSFEASGFLMSFFFC